MPPKVSTFTKNRKLDSTPAVKTGLEVPITEVDKENAQANDGFLLDEPPSPLDFAKFYPWSCRKMGADGDVVIITIVQERYTKKPKKAMELAESESTLCVRTEIIKSKSEWNKDACGKRGAIPMQATYDGRGPLVELLVTASDLLTQKHLKILQMCVRFQPNLTKITITKCKLNQEVLYELGWLLKRSRITELILDDTICREGNFYAILEYENILKRLSLNRCNINDTIMIELFKRVEEPLQILELSGNFITVLSIRRLAKVLRTNRSLIHLNLAGNSINDDAVALIMGTLMKFELTKKEILELRIRKLNYFKKRKICFEEQKRRVELRTTMGPSKKNVRPASAKSVVPLKKGESTVNSDVIAEKMTYQLMGTFTDAFDDEHIVIENDKIFCLGNFILSSINFAYNDLSHTGMKNILNVLEYQKPPVVSATAGLVRLVVNGNNLCEKCEVQESIFININSKLAEISDKRRQYVASKHAHNKKAGLIEADAMHSVN